MTDEKVQVSQEELDQAFGKNQKNAQQLEMDAIAKTVSDIKHKIIVCSGKGGVGKTTVAVNLAIELANQGLSVGILDVDITGPNVPKMLHLEGQRPDVIVEEKLFKPINGPLNIKVMSMGFLLETSDTPVIWRGPMKMKAIRQFLAEGKWGQLDYLISDLPPGTSDETLDVMQLTEGEVVIVTTPQDVATLDSRKTVMMAKALKRNVVGIVENMSGFTVKCPDCGKSHTYDLFGSGGGEKAANDLNVPFLGAIPIEQGVRDGGDAGLPFALKDPDAASSKAFVSIVNKIRESLES
jgi:ATP-binding protein involved in chromosome partitioning